MVGREGIGVLPGAVEWRFRELQIPKTQLASKLKYNLQFNLCSMGKQERSERQPENCFFNKILLRYV